MISSVTAGIGQQENSTGLGELGTDMFLKLLIAQLQNQNPLEPMDGSALMQQTSTLANVEAIQAVAELQKHIVGLSQFGNATNMIGKIVQADHPVLGLIEGSVTGVRVSENGPILRIDGQDVSIDSVVSVLARPTVVAQEQPTELAEAAVTAEGDV